MVDVLALQMTLRDAGFNPGAVDGVMGRRTIAAIAAFQADRRLNITNPGTVGPITLAALGLPYKARQEAVEAPWLGELERRIGLHETRDRSKLMAWLRSDGRTLGDPAVLPWCGDAVATAIALTLPAEVLPVNPYLARNWLKFGLVMSVPYPGAIGVFWRGKIDGTAGHVGIIKAVTPTGYIVVGGNQRNQIGEDELGADRLLGLRWPVTATLPTASRVVKLPSRSSRSTNED